MSCQVAAHFFYFGCRILPLLVQYVVWVSGFGECFTEGYVPSSPLHLTFGQYSKQNTSREGQVEFTYFH